MLHLLYFRHVLVNPKERKVVVVESLLTPTLFRETLAKVLFTHYEVSGVVWADSPRLCALTLGTPVALIVSIGAKEAEVAAVVHSCVVLHAMESQPLGAHAIHAELPEVARTRTTTRTLRSARPGHRGHQSEDLFRGQPQSRPASGRRRGRRATCSSRAASAADCACPAPRASEPPRCSSPGTHELASLPDIVLQCIMRCPIDARRAPRGERAGGRAARRACPGCARGLAQGSCGTSSPGRLTRRGCTCASSSSTARRRRTARRRGWAARCWARARRARRAPLRGTCTRARGACATGCVCSTNTPPPPTRTGRTSTYNAID
ncbi:unnamed protein product [Arctia plantaginis]|uniref:Uncharacterized protein n=1 Tax=Arctia plantaginis TaxID=874455 RepID=A0A8S1AVF0_ARCPL|nr:unnamed protein product [Arctia plantaginis]